MGRTQPYGLGGVVGSHCERLLRSAVLLCGNEAEAQDLVQETLLRALESAERFRGDSTVHTWLHGILVNLSHRRIRERGRLVFEEELAGKGTVLQPSSAEAMEDDFFADKVAEAVQRLSPEHRRVIVLRYYNKLKIKDIAVLMGVSTGTVKSRLHYAIRSLKRFIPNRLHLLLSKRTHGPTP